MCRRRRITAELRVQWAAGTKAADVQLDLRWSAQRKHFLHDVSGAMATLTPLNIKSAWTKAGFDKCLEKDLYIEATRQPGIAEPQPIPTGEEDQGDEEELVLCRRLPGDSDGEGDVAGPAQQAVRQRFLFQCSCVLLQGFSVFVQDPTKRPV